MKLVIITYVHNWTRKYLEIRKNTIHLFELHIILPYTLFRDDNNYAYSID